MKILIKTIAQILAFTAFFLGSLQFAHAGEAKMMVTDAWARPVILKNRPGAAYFMIMNHTDKDDKLIAAFSTMAERVELHTHKHEMGVMKMMKVDSIPVKSHGTVLVKPSGYHLMLFGLKEKLKEGDSLPLTLKFKHAGEMKITAKVMKKTMKKMDHKKMEHKH